MPLADQIFLQEMSVPAIEEAEGFVSEEKGVATGKGGSGRSHGYSGGADFRDGRVQDLHQKNNHGGGNAHLLCQEREGNFRLRDVLSVSSQVKRQQGTGFWR